MVVKLLCGKPGSLGGLLLWVLLYLVVVVMVYGSLFKFIYEELYNGKLAMRYGHALTNECPLCHMPDSCTHIVGECPDHEVLRISYHNAACQLIHAAIRKTAKGMHTSHAHIPRLRETL